MCSINRCWIGLLLGLFSFISITHSEEPVPSDVHYMLEDLYGGDQGKWPKPIYSQDVNGDGQLDWLVQQPGCKNKGQCIVDLFLCNRAEGQRCKEYCYTGSVRQDELASSVGSLKCQATC